MSEGGKRPVWVYVGDRANVVISATDPHAERNFLAQVEACKTVADVRRLNEQTGGDLEPAIEMFDEDGWPDDAAWEITDMPGYGDGDWPPQDELGVTDLFTDEQVGHLIEHYQAEVVDNMGGYGEELYIPDSQIEQIRSLLPEWGFDVQGTSKTLQVHVPGHDENCHTGHGHRPQTAIVWPDGIRNTVPTWCRSQSVSIDAALTDYPPIRDSSIQGVFEQDDWISRVTLYLITDDMFLLVVGETDARARLASQTPEGESFEVIAVRGTQDDAVALWERQFPRHG